MPHTFRIAFLGAPPSDLGSSPFGPFSVEECASLDALAAQLEAESCDAVLVDVEAAGGAERLLQWAALPRAVLESALIATSAQPTPVECLRLLHAGVRDVISTNASPAVFGRMVRIAIERKRQDDAAKRAYTIDLTTGLPSLAQLQEHMSHLLALREREPAAMALVVVQLSGAGAVESTLGSEAANVLRRKVAVRLRSSLRASDVVASLGPDLFGVLLAWLDGDDAAPHVARKLLNAVTQPFKVAGQAVPISARMGLAQYPQHGREAKQLMRHAVSQATGDDIGRLMGAPAANDDAG